MAQDWRSLMQKQCRTCNRERKTPMIPGRQKFLKIALFNVIFKNNFQ